MYILNIFLFNFQEFDEVKLIKILTETHFKFTTFGVLGETIK